MMHIEIRAEDFEPYSLLLEHQQRLDLAGKYGATAVFVGTMRDFNEAEDVRAMRLEHYPGMTEKYLEKISAEAAASWDLLDSLIVHRIGHIEPDHAIVLVVVWSAHRKDSFEASRFLMEELKSRAPFWKKESLAQGERWVDQNTQGY